LCVQVGVAAENYETGKRITVRFDLATDARFFAIRVTTR
jgi:hypothetical protein